MADSDEEVFRHATVPMKMRETRACMTCSLVKQYSHFSENGCDNCPFLQMRENRQRVSDCTSAFFEG